MINTIITGQAARRSQSMSIATLFTCCIKGNKVCVVAGRRSFDGLKHATFTRRCTSSSSSSNGATTSTPSSVPSDNSDVIANTEPSVSSSSDNSNKPSSQGDNIATTASPPNDSLHSTDIAFKPTESGWGYNPRYSKSFDNIFATRDKKEQVVSSKPIEGEEINPTPTTWPFNDKDIIKQRRQLQSIIENALALTKKEQRQLVDTININLKSKK